MPQMGPNRRRCTVVVRVLMMLLLLLMLLVQQKGSILLRGRYFERILGGISRKLLMMMLAMGLVKMVLERIQATE